METTEYHTKKQLLVIPKAESEMAYSTREMTE
jgi:hypothetical protein